MVIFGLIQPIMFVVLFTYVFGGSMQIGDSTDLDVYKNFLMAGIFAQTVTFATASSGAGIADDMHKGLIDRFRSLPSPHRTYRPGSCADGPGYAFTWIGALIGLSVRTPEAATSGGLIWLFPVTFISNALWTPAR